MTWYEDLATGAYEELLNDGAPGPEAVRLTSEIADAVTRFGPFPAPSGGPSWSPEEVEEAAADFFTHKHTARRFATITVRATSARSFAAQLEQAFRNYLRDEARDTDRGHLIGRLRGVLGSDARFSQVGQGGARAWHLADAETTLTSRSEDELARAAFAVQDIRQIRWSSRRGPVASRQDLARLLGAILDSADGAVAEPSLVDIVARRFGLALDGTAESLDDLADDSALADRDLPVSTAPEIRDEARRVWPQLTRRERLILAYADLTDRQLADVLGLGSSAANTARHRLGHVLRTAIGDHPQGQEVYELLQQAATDWVHHRTEDISYSSDVVTPGGRVDPTDTEPDTRGSRSFDDHPGAEDGT